MKKFFAIAALFISLLNAAPSIAEGGGSDTPFPLDFPLPFPWGSIEGVWEVGNANQKIVFSFEVQTNCDHTQILKVKQVDPTNGSILAEGIGYMSPNATTVYAGMQGNGGSYFILVGAYNEKVGIEMKRFYGLRIFPFSDMAAEERYRINKIQDDAIPSPADATCVNPTVPSPTPVPTPVQRPPSPSKSRDGR